MKKMNFVAIAFLLVGMAAQASADVNPNVRLENFTLGPSQASPGDLVTLTLELGDWSDVCAEKVSAQVSAAYPLAVRGPDTQFIDLLCQSDNGSGGTLAYSVYVDPLAQTGDYPISLATAYKKTFLSYSGSSSINLRVQGQPSIFATVASSSPVDIYPGDSAAVTVRVDNKGSGYVTSARATLSAQGVEVKWAGREAELGQIPPRSSSQAVFSIEAPQDLSPGDYPATLLVDYVSEDNSAGMQSFKFVIPVKQKADFQARAEGDGLVIGETGSLHVVLKNTGTDEARRVKVSIKPVFPFSTDGTIRYVESLAPGAEAALDYQVPVDKQATGGSQLLTLDIAYEDPQGKKLSDSADFTLVARGRTPVETVVSYWYVAAIALLAAGWFVTQRQGKKK